MHSEEDDDDDNASQGEVPSRCWRCFKDERTTKKACCPRNCDLSQESDDYNELLCDNCLIRVICGLCGAEGCEHCVHEDHYCARSKVNERWVVVPCQVQRLCTGTCDKNYAAVLFACGHFQCVVWEAEAETTSSDKCSYCRGPGEGREEFEKLLRDAAHCALASSLLESGTTAMWFAAVTKWLQTMPQQTNKLTAEQLSVLGDPRRIIKQVVGVLAKEAEVIARDISISSSLELEGTPPTPQSKGSSQLAPSISSINETKTVYLNAQESPAYFCFHESTVPPHTSIFWSPQGFFRANKVNLDIKPMTPVLICTSTVQAKNVGSASANLCQFLSILFKGSNPQLPPPLIPGSFVPQGSDSSKYTFVFNPDNALRHNVKSTFFANHFCNVSMNTPLLARFTTNRMQSDARNAIFPRILNVKSLADSTLPLFSDPNSFIPPSLFLQDLRDTFDAFLIIGGSNDLSFPCIDFNDFTSLYNSGPLSWLSIILHLIRKYKSLHAQSTDPKEKSKFAKFAAAIEEHSSKNANPKGILLFPGRWKGLNGREALLLAQRLSTESNHSIYVIHTAHPNTTPANAHELNPFLTGPATQKFIDERHLYDSVVGMGEVDIRGEVCFNFSHNCRNFIVVRVCPTTPLTKDLLASVNVIPASAYKGPRITETDSDLHLYSIILSLPHQLRPPRLRNTCTKILSDMERIWPNFSVYSISSQDEKTISRIDQNVTSTGLLGKIPATTFSPDILASPCAPDNKTRIIKLSNLTPFSLIQHRFAPISLLTKLGLVKTAIPLSNFFLKVEALLDDDQMISELRKLNIYPKAPTFQYLYNGSAFLLVQDTSNNTTQKQQPFYLIMYDPPEQMTPLLAEQWCAEQGLGQLLPRASRAYGPKGTSLVVTLSHWTEQAANTLSYVCDGDERKVVPSHQIPEDVVFEGEDDIEDIPADDSVVYGCPPDYAAFIDPPPTVSSSAAPAASSMSPSPASSSIPAPLTIKT